MHAPSLNRRSGFSVSPPKKRRTARPGIIRSALSAVAILGGCASVSTDWDYDGDCDFTQLHRYEWIGVRAARTAAVAEHLKNTIDRALLAKGFSAAPADPDFRIVVYFDPSTARIRRANDHHPTSLGLLVSGIAALFGGADGGFHPPLGTANPGGPAGTESLRLEFVHPQTRELLWRGRAIAPFSARMSDDERAELIDRAVARLLAEFPPEG